MSSPTNPLLRELLANGFRACRARRRMNTSFMAQGERLNQPIDYSFGAVKSGDEGESFVSRHISVTVKSVTFLVFHFDLEVVHVSYEDDFHGIIVSAPALMSSVPKLTADAGEVPCPFMSAASADCVKENST